MIIVLGVPVLLTAFVSTLTTNNSMTRIEQFNNQEDEAEHEDDVEDDYEQHSNEHKSGKKHKKKKKQHINTKYNLDKETTEANFYNDLSTSKDISSDDLSDMTQHTEKLIQKQKKLKDTMNQLMPIANKTNEFMNSIDIDKLAGLVGNLKGF